VLFGDVRFAEVAGDLDATAQALDGVLQSFELLDSLGQRSAQAGDIASNLVGEPGTWATLDDLLQQGRISVDQYWAAVEAGAVIARNDARVQADLNAIRAAQLPLLADQEKAYAQQVHQLAQLTSEEFQHAAALLDSESAAKAAAAQSALYAASLGDIPPETATKIVLDAANADAEVAALLESFGIIERTAEGGWQMAFEIQGDGKQTIEDVTAAIDRLNNTIVEVGIATTGDESLAALKTDVEELDGSTVTIDVELRAAQGRANAGAMGGLVGAPESQTVTIESEFDDAGVQEAEKALGGFDGTVYTAKIDADISGFDEGFVAVVKEGGIIAGATYTADLTADISGWNTAQDQVTNEGATFANTTFTAKLDGDGTLFHDELNTAMVGGQSFSEAVYTATLDADDGPFWAAVEAIPQTLGTRYIEIDARDSDGDTQGGGGGGKLHGGAVLPGRLHGGAVGDGIPSSRLASIPAAQHGRAVWVGESGRELAILPGGTMVLPHPASEAAAAERSVYRQPGMAFYAPVNIVAQTPDIYAAISQQLVSQGR
jgi:hypothetical protein